MAINEALRGIRAGHGGPFGSVIVKNGAVVGAGHNSVFLECDPTAHGEIMAVRDACRTLGTFDLSGCTVYTNSEPCPMCRAALCWAKADRVVYSSTVREAGEIAGFKDPDMYESLRGGGDLIPSVRIKTEGYLEPFEEYRKMKGPVYG